MNGALFGGAVRATLRAAKPMLYPYQSPINPLHR